MIISCHTVILQYLLYLLRCYPSETSHNFWRRLQKANPMNRQSSRQTAESKNVDTVGDKIKFPLCTNSPPTRERSCQQKLPKSRPKVAAYFKRNQKSRRLIFIWGKNCLRAYSVQTQVASMRKWNKKKLQFFLLESVAS